MLSPRESAATGEEVTYVTQSSICNMTVEPNRVVSADRQGTIISRPNLTGALRVAKRACRKRQLASR